MEECPNTPTTNSACPSHPFVRFDILQQRLAVSQTFVAFSAFLLTHTPSVPFSDLKGSMWTRK